MTKPQPLDRLKFSLFRDVPTRWSDNDVYGHVNNVIHYQMFDTAVNGWLIERGLLDYRSGETIGVVVDTACTYFRDFRFPDIVHVGIRVAHLGNSSVRYELALFVNDDETAAAQGHFVHVYVDRTTRRPEPLSPHWRQVLAAIVG